MFGSATPSVAIDNGCTRICFVDSPIQFIFHLDDDIEMLELMRSRPLNEPADDKLACGESEFR